MLDKIISLIEDFKSDSKLRSESAESQICLMCTHLIDRLSKLSISGNVFDGIEWDSAYSSFKEVNYVTPSKLNVFYRNTFNGDAADVDLPLDWFRINYNEFWEDQKSKAISKKQDDIKLLYRTIAFRKEEISKIKALEMPKLE